MINGTKYTPKQMLATLKKLGALGTEEDREVLLDVARILAEITVAVSRVKNKAIKLHMERQVLGEDTK